MELQTSSNWNKFDDTFFVIKKSWMESRWKEFTAFNYVMSHLASGKSLDSLNLAQISQNTSNPGEIPNQHLLLENYESFENRLKGSAYVNS